MGRQRGIVAAMEGYMTVAEVKKDYHVHYRNTCPECGNTQTCKCAGKTPENTEEFKFKCHECAGPDDMHFSPEVSNRAEVAQEGIGGALLGALGGAAAGGHYGGPIGAVVGGVTGAYAGHKYQESERNKVAEEEKNKEKREEIKKKKHKIEEHVKSTTYTEQDVKKRIDEHYKGEYENDSLKYHEFVLIMEKMGKNMEEIFDNNPKGFANEEISSDNHQHTRNTCPYCHRVETCRCKAPKVETKKRCFICQGDKVVGAESITPGVNEIQSTVEVNPSAVDNSKTITTEPVINTTSQEEVIRSQMEAEGFDVNDAGERFKKEMESAGVDETGLAAVTKQLDETVKVNQALEAIFDSLRSAVAVSQTTVAMANNSLSILCDQTDIKKKPNLSLETFRTSREVALEEIADTAKRIWQKILEYIQKAIDYVRDFFTKIFASTSMLKKQAAYLRAQIAKADVSSPDKTINNPELIKSLSINGAMPEKFKPHLDDFEEQVKNTLNASLGTNVKMAHILNKVFDQADKDGYYRIRNSISLPADHIDQSTVVTGENVPSQFTSGPTIHRNLVVCRSHELFGNKALYATMRSKDMEGAEAIIALEHTRAGVHDYNLNSNVIKEGQFHVLSQREMSEIIDTVEKVLDIIAQYKSNSEQLQEVKKKFLTIGMRLAPLRFEDEHIQRDNQRLIQSAVRVIDHPGTDMAKYGLSTCNHLIKYVRESLKHYTANETSNTAQAVPA